MTEGNKREQFQALYAKLSVSLPPDGVKAAIMTLMGISDARYRAYKSESAPALATQPSASYIPAPTPRPFPKPLRAPDENALIVGDLHAPFHNRAFYAVALAVAQSMGIRRTCFIGDIFNFDSINRHPKTGPDTDPEVDVIVGGGCLLVASQVMDEIYIMKGNHDANMAKRLDKKWPMRLLISAALNGRRPGSRVFVTDRDWIHLGDTWDIGHLSQYSRKPGAKAASIAERRDKNIAVGHDHFQGFMSTADGRHIGISVGSMLLKNHFWYKEESLNDFPHWANGFMVIKNGVPILFNEHGSSPLNGSKSWGYWEAELGIDIRSIFERYAEDNEREQFYDLDNKENEMLLEEISGSYEL